MSINSPALKSRSPFTIRLRNALSEIFVLRESAEMFTPICLMQLETFIVTASANVEASFLPLMIFC